MKKVKALIPLMVIFLVLTGCSEKKQQPQLDCIFDGELVQGAEYVNGQYTYRYSQAKSYNDEWVNINEDGWGVALTDEKSKEPVTSKLCSTINGKPIVSMSYMFYDSQAESIDLSSFNTSKVIDMGFMFANSKATSINLGSFDTSNVIDMHGMFYDSQAESIDLSSFNTSKVIDMGKMFANSKATSINLSSFDTSNVTYMAEMFFMSATTSLDLSNFDTSNVTQMGYMFYKSQAESIDLSSFDTSKVSNMNNMFRYSKATEGYARTKEDADRFNKSYNKPSSLNFVVKK